MKISSIVFTNKDSDDHSRITSVISHSFTSISGKNVTPEFFTSFESGMPYIANALKTSNVLAIFADDDFYHDAKKAICKAFKFDMIHNEDVLDKLRSNDNYERYMMHAIMPKNATAFPLSDGLFSGFAIKSKTQCIFFLPFSQDRTFITMKKYVFPYLSKIINNMLPSFKEYELAYAAAVLARQIEDTDIQIAISNTPCSRYIAHASKKDECFKEHISYAPYDEKQSNKKGVQSVAVNAAEYYECRFGGAIIEGERDESGLFTATIILSDKKTVTIRNITSIPDESHDDFMYTVVTEMFLMLAEIIYTAPQITDDEVVAIKPTSVISRVKILLYIILLAISCFLTFVSATFSTFSIF